MIRGNDHDPVQSSAEGRMSRREFVVRALGMGISASSMGTILAACGGGGLTSSQKGEGQSVAMGSATQGLSKKYSGQTIAVALAITSVDKKLLQKFTSQTGIKVKWTVYGWDALQNKITAAASANTFFADVTDVDWSRVGLYARTKWFAPLKFSDLTSLKKDVPQLDVFTVDGQLIGMPNDASIMVTTVNTKDFEQAGIKKMPATFEEYESALKQIQKSGVNAHPLGIPFAAAEGLSTYWYQLTGGAFGGKILSDDFEPLFTDESSPGYKAMEWMVEQYKSGMVPKENIDLTDSSEMQSQMALDKLSSIFSDYSGNVSTLYNVPSQSKVTEQIKYLPTPGKNGQGPNLGNPDGVGIPVSARHKGAAAQFIKWYTSTEVQARLAGAYEPVETGGIAFPMRLSSMKILAKNTSAQGAQLLELFKDNSRPVFPGGPPPWYPTFSDAVYTNIHSAALGQKTVEQAIKEIARTVSKQSG